MTITILSFFPQFPISSPSLLAWEFLSPPTLMSHPPVRPTLMPCPNPDAYARPPSGWVLSCPTSLPHLILAMLLPRSIRRWRHCPSLLRAGGQIHPWSRQAHQSQRKLSEASIFSFPGGSWPVRARFGGLKCEAVFKTPIWQLKLSHKMYQTHP